MKKVLFKYTFFFQTLRFANGSPSKTDRHDAKQLKSGYSHFTIYHELMLRVINALRLIIWLDKELNCLKNPIKYRLAFCSLVVIFAHIRIEFYLWRKAFHGRINLNCNSQRKLHRHCGSGICVCKIKVKTETPKCTKWKAPFRHVIMPAIEWLGHWKMH